VDSYVRVVAPDPLEEETMSTTLAPTTTSAATAVPGRVRAAIVSGLVTLGAAVLAVLVLWQPWGARDQLGYADLAPHRDAAWLGAVVDGLAFAAVCVALALAVCRLAPGRGWVWATVGAVVTGVGGVAFAAGMAAFGSLAWYATSTDAVPAQAGTALMTYVEDNPGHVLGLQMAGFLLATLGTLALMVALWRARSVPRWLPIAYLVLTVGVFALSGVALNIVQAAQTLSLVVVAFYAWRVAARPADLAA
jgi:hypothetical protein